MTGYHATTKEAAYEIVNKGIWIPSTGNGEWFGHGVYFWPSIEAAEIWIQKKCARSGAIIQATIVTGFCIDSDNYSKFGELFYEAHLHLKKIHAVDGKEMPIDDGEDRQLSCRVFNTMCKMTHPIVDTVIGTLDTGDSIVPGSAIRKNSQKQICVRNTRCILHPVILSEER